MSSRLNEVDKMIVDELCREKAKSISVYADPIDLGGYEFWDEYEYIGRDEAVKDCWYWQLAYWVTADVIDTIGTANRHSKNVLTSPVKRLLEVTFATDTSRRGRTRGRTRVIDDKKPTYILSPEEDGLTDPLTTRFCNDDIDVIHFKIVVEVGTKAVLPFMQELCSGRQHKFAGWNGKANEQTFVHNQITILESGIEPVDRQDADHELYRYGEDAVVRLDLICEYVFKKKAYEQIKPDAVKQSVLTNQ